MTNVTGWHWQKTRRDGAGVTWMKWYKLGIYENAWSEALYPLYGWSRQPAKHSWLSSAVHYAGSTSPLRAAVNITRYLVVFTLSNRATWTSWICRFRPSRTELCMQWSVIGLCCASPALVSPPVDHRINLSEAVCALRSFTVADRCRGSYGKLG